MLVSGLVRSIDGGIAEIVINGSIVKLPSDSLAVGDRVQLQQPPPLSAHQARAFALPSQLTVLPGEVAEGMDPEFDTADDDVQPATAGDRESRPLSRS